MEIRWITAFLDTTTGSAGPSELFWAALTHTQMSPRRGPEGAFATLLPRDGDAFLRVQRTRAGAAGLHLDLHVEDVAAAAQVAVRAGAQEVARLEDYRILRSPGGFVFCFVPDAGHAQRPAPSGERGNLSLLDQVCLDIAPGLFAAEAAFWATITGWVYAPAARPEFAVLERPRVSPSGCCCNGSTRARPSTGTSTSRARTSKRRSTGTSPSGRGSSPGNSSGRCWPIR